MLDPTYYAYEILEFIMQLGPLFKRQGHHQGVGPAAAPAEPPACPPAPTQRTLTRQRTPAIGVLRPRAWGRGVAWQVGRPASCVGVGALYLPTQASSDAACSSPCPPPHLFD